MNRLLPRLRLKSGVDIRVGCVGLGWYMYSKDELLTVRGTPDPPKLENRMAPPPLHRGLILGNWSGEQGRGRGERGLHTTLQALGSQLSGQLRELFEILGDKTEQALTGLHRRLQVLSLSEKPGVGWSFMTVLTSPGAHTPSD